MEIPRWAKRIYTEVPDHWGRLAFWGAACIALPLAMVWLALQLWWFWFWFRWLGIAMVVLATWALLGVGLGGYRSFRRAGVNLDANEFGRRLTALEEDSGSDGD